MLASCTQEESTNFFLPSQKKPELYYVLKYFRFVFKSVRVVTGLLTFWKISGKFLEVSQKLCEWVLFQFFPGNFLKSVRVGTYPRFKFKFINPKVSFSKVEYTGVHTDSHTFQEISGKKLKKYLLAHFLGNFQNISENSPKSLEPCYHSHTQIFFSSGLLSLSMF